MKKFDEFKINEEWSAEDTENLKYMANLIHRKVPTFDVEFNQFYGRVNVDNKEIFSTEGNQSPAVISAFVNGYLWGLYKK